MKPQKWLTRRNILKGAGVSLALPWLETLVPTAKAQVGRTKRFLFLYVPNGVALDYWPAAGSGEGAAWQLSPLQEPMQPHKQFVSVLSNVENRGPFGDVNPNPSHSQCCAPTLSCTQNHPSEAVLNGVTVDQILAQAIGDQTPFDSLQLGLSTIDSYPDGQHPAISRSISWAASDRPLYKEINPQAVYDRLVAQLGSTGEMTAEAQQQAALRKAQGLSVLDFVLDQANQMNARLSTDDQRRLDQFLTSVQDLEGRVQQQGALVNNEVNLIERPGVVVHQETNNPGVALMTEGAYNRNDHAEVMNDLINLAFQADLTRVITHMVDDARSDYHYNFLKRRTFTTAGSTEVNEQLVTQLQGDLLGFHGLQHDGDSNDGFATVNYWMVTKFKSMLDRLSTTPEPDGSGTTLLDNSIVVYMSGMQGANHNADHLPIMLAGSGNGVFKQNVHHDFATERRLADVHATILRDGFGLDMANVGNSQGIVPEILA